jgi:hypothetical protein
MPSWLLSARNGRGMTARRGSLGLVSGEMRANRTCAARSECRTCLGGNVNRCDLRFRHVPRAGAKTHSTSRSAEEDEQSSRPARRW